MDILHLRQLDDSPKWRDQAACRVADPEVFYSHTYYNPKTEQDEHEKRIRAAKAFCGGCDVQIDCLGSALIEEAAEADSGGAVGTMPYRHGIRGGATELEREVIANRASDVPLELALAGTAMIVHR